jgi:hypothetical protein
MNDVAAITCFFNFEKNPDKLKKFIKFKDAIEKQGVPLFVIEISPEGVIPVLRKACGKGKYMSGKTIVPVLIKGNALNVLSSHIPKEYKNIAWLNWGTTITNENWAEEACVLLDNYKLVKIGRDSDWESPMVVKRDFFEMIGLFDYDFCGNSNLITFLSAVDDSTLYNYKDLLDLYEESNLEIFYKILSYKQLCYNYFNGSVTCLDSTIKNISNSKLVSVEQSIGLLKHIDADYNIHYENIHKLIAVKNLLEFNYPANMLNLLKKV